MKDVQLTPANGVTNDQIWVTSADPSTISQNAGDSSNDPSQNAAWCKLTDSSCLGGKDITAYQLRLTSYPDGYFGSIRVSGLTTGDSAGQVLVNNLGTGSSAGLSPIPATANQPVTLYLSKITGSVYEDGNRDGAHQAAENLVPNYTVNLLDSSGATVKTTTTDSSGNYSFGDLVAGTYTVKITDPTGKYTGVTQAYKTVKIDGTAGTSSGDVALPRDGSTNNVDFGLKVANDAITITKTGKAVDTNNDGSVDGADYTFTVTNTGERALTGVAVNDSLLAGAGIAVTCEATDLAVGASTTCHSASTYPFTTADYDRGYVDNTATSTGNNPEGKPVTSTPATARVDVPEPSTSALLGTVYSDTNRDGAQQPGENGVNAYKVDLLDSTGAVVKSTTTGSDGAYSFTNLTPGTYSVRIADPTNPYAGITQAYKVTVSNGTPTTSSGSVTVPRATNVANVDFGLKQLTDGITIKKTGNAVDTDQDGAVDAATYSFTVTNTGERALTGVKVNDSLLSAAGIGVTCDATDLAVGASTTCTSNSAYPFSAADYARGYVDNTATSTGNNPDGNPVTSTPDTARVPAPKPATGSLSGVVYGDTSKDGVRQPADEQGVASYTVDLLDSTGAVIQSATTGADGSYSFTGLVAGTYAVRIADPTNPYNGVSQAYKTVKPDGTAGTGSGDVAVSQGQNTGGVDFGLLQPVPTTTTPTTPTTPTADPGTTPGTTPPTTTTTEPGTTTSTTSTTSTSAVVPGRISGRVYHDQKPVDGAWQSGEDGVKGWHVTLLDSKDAEVASVDVGPDGSYVFDKITPGAYHVAIAKITDPWVGITQAYTNVKLDGSAGVDSGTLTVVAGGEVTDVNFGLIQKAPATTTTPVPTNPTTSTTTTTTTTNPTGPVNPGNPGGTTTPTSPTTDPTEPTASSTTTTTTRPTTPTTKPTTPTGTPTTSKTTPGMPATTTKPGTPGSTTSTPGTPGGGSTTSTTSNTTPGTPGTTTTPNIPGITGGGHGGHGGNGGTVPGVPGGGGTVPPQQTINTGNPGNGSTNTLPLALGGVLVAAGLVLMSVVLRRRRREN